MTGYDGSVHEPGQVPGRPDVRPRPLPTTGAVGVPAVPVVHDATGRRLDQIVLSGVSAVGRHGVFEGERREGQLFVADVVAHLDTRRAAAGDDLALTVNYGVLAEQVAAVLAGDPADLVETVAERIAATVLASPLVAAVDVLLHKPQAPITVPFDDVVVSIHRDRTTLPAAEPYRPAPVGQPAPRDLPAGGPTHTAVLPVTPAAGALGETPLGAGLAGLAGVAPEGAEHGIDGASAPVPAAPGPAAVGPVPSAGVQVAPVSADVLGSALPWAAAAPVTPPSLPLGEAWEPVGALPRATAEDTAVEDAYGPAPTLPDAAPAPSPGTALVELEAPVEVVVGEIELDALDVAPSAPVHVVLAIGANLGNAQETLRQAVSDLAAVPGLHVDDVSALARTAAVGGPEQPDYLNAVLLARTTLSARDLLRATQAVEQAHGRERLVHWGPRTLDVDIVAYGTTLATTDDLELPHPRAHERAFVLQPWAQVDPDAVLPGLGGGPVAALAATAPDRDGVRWLALDWLTSPVPAAQPDPGVEA